MLGSHINPIKKWKIAHCSRFGCILSSNRFPGTWCVLVFRDIYTSSKDIQLKHYAESREREKKELICDSSVCWRVSNKYWSLTQVTIRLGEAYTILGVGTMYWQLLTHQTGPSLYRSLCCAPHCCYNALPPIATPGHSVDVCGKINAFTPEAKRMAVH